jgi:hypothetical protein
LPAAGFQNRIPPWETGGGRTVATSPRILTHDLRENSRAQSVTISVSGSLGPDTFFYRFFR